MNIPHILCVGSATADHIFKIGGFPLDPVKVRADDYGFSGGGIAANAAVAIARLGGRAEFCGRLGADRAGRDLIDDFRRHGVGTDAVLVREGTRASTSVVLVDEKGERFICNYRGQFTADSDGFDTSMVRASLASASVILADVSWHDGVAAILRCGEPRIRRIARACRHSAWRLWKRWPQAMCFTVLMRWRWQWGKGSRQPCASPAPQRRLNVPGWEAAQACRRVPR